jgi:SAM-dependent methyltransferase
MTTQAEDIHAAVRARYGGRAREVAERGSETDAGSNALTLYPDAGELPGTLVSYGCGNPVAIAGLQAGETVLDLGSGAGLDCFLAAERVGATGRAIGLDMTEEMLTLAEQNRAKLGVQNVEFRQGLIEDIPLADASVDVIISNCVINLSPDKDAVFREALRVLRRGGRLQVSDVVLRREITAEERGDLDLWSGCKSGALLIEDYESRLRAAGFADVEVVVSDPTADDGPAWVSALINARRPGAANEGAPWQLRRGEIIEFLAPAGLEAGACCDVDGECC